MDKLQWFKFTPTDWIMGKIQRCPEITQARFMRLICLYWNKECTLSYEDAEIEIDKEHLDILVSKKIIKVSEEFIIIEFLQEQFLEISLSKKDQSKGGQLGNLKRWHPDLYKKVSDKSITLSDAYAIINLSVPDKDAITTQSGFVAEKKREEKTREEEIKEILDKKKKDFVEAIKPHKQNFTSQMLNDFYDYWTETKPNSKLVRWEREKAFDMARRLDYWSRNDGKFGSTKQPQKVERL